MSANKSEMNSDVLFEIESCWTDVFYFCFVWNITSDSWEFKEWTISTSGVVSTEVLV